MSIEDSSIPTLRFRRDVFATMLFDGSAVYPSSPFAFLEPDPRASETEVAVALGAGDTSPEELADALRIIRRPDRVVLVFEQGPNGNRRMPFVGRGPSFVLSFLGPTDECLISKPIASVDLAEMLLANIGWSPAPAVSELPPKELPPGRLDVFSMEIQDDTPPAGASAMSRAAFAGPRGSRVMVLPRRDEDVVGIAALEERDLRTLVCVLLGLPRPPAHPPPQKVIEFAVHEDEVVASWSLFVFEEQLIEHRVTRDAYVVERYPVEDLRARIAVITGLRPTAVVDPAPVRVMEDDMRPEAPQDRIPPLLAAALRDRRRLVVASILRPGGDVIDGVEITWIDSGEGGIWRIEPAAQPGEVSVQNVTGESIEDELLVDG